MKPTMYTNISNLGYLLQSEKKKQVGIKHTNSICIFKNIIFRRQ